MPWEGNALSGGVRVPCCSEDVQAPWLRAVSGLGYVKHKPHQQVQRGEHWLFVPHQPDLEAQPQSRRYWPNDLFLCCVVNSAGNVMEAATFEDAPSLLAVVDDEMAHFIH